MRDAAVGRVWRLSELRVQAIAAVGGPGTRDPSLPSSELQRLLAEALGPDGIAEWLGTDPVLPTAYEHTQLETARWVLTAQQLQGWLGGTYVPPAALGLGRSTLPPAIGIPWLCHIACSLRIESAEPQDPCEWTVAVRTPLCGKPGAVLALGDRETVITREGVRTLTDKLRDVADRPEPGCTDSFTRWEEHCGCK